MTQGKCGGFVAAGGIGNDDTNRVFEVFHYTGICRCNFMRNCSSDPGVAITDLKQQGPHGSAGSGQERKT